MISFVAFRWLQLFLFVLISTSHAESVYDKACRTSKNEVGRCMPIFSCKHLYALVERINESGVSAMTNNDDISYLQSLSCGMDNGVPHVCCKNDQIQLNKRGLKILQDTNCGPFVLPKISNGWEADLFAFPWMALLKYKNKRIRCAGSLISDRYVLTAAHCVDKGDDPVYEVRLGEHRISTEEDCTLKGPYTVCAPPVEDYGIERIMLPPGRQVESLHHDIALIRLNRTVQFSKEKRHIKPICLPITDELKRSVPDGYIVSGWGRTENESRSDVLMWTRVPHRKIEDCEKSLGLIGLTEREICAGGEDLRDSCTGDSGGPLSQPSSYNGQIRLVQFGTVSAGIDSCGKESVPAIYMSVPYYLQWITDYMEA